MRNSINKIRRILFVFIVLLILSGLTAFPIETQLEFILKNGHFLPEKIYEWLQLVYSGVSSNNRNFPFIAYGTDWLAFAHIVIAIFFLGAFKDPVKNIWPIKAGLLACLLVFPLAFIAGSIRGIPLWWQLIDCTFGFFGFLMLFWVYRLTRELENVRRKTENFNVN